MRAQLNGDLDEVRWQFLSFQSLFSLLLSSLIRQLLPVWHGIATGNSWRRTTRCSRNASPRSPLLLSFSLSPLLLLVLVLLCCCCCCCCCSRSLFPTFPLWLCHMEPSLTGWSVAVFGADGRGHGGGEWTVIGCHCSFLESLMSPSLSHSGSCCFHSILRRLQMSPFRSEHVEPSLTGCSSVVVLAQMGSWMKRVSGQ